MIRLIAFLLFLLPSIVNAASSCQSGETTTVVGFYPAGSVPSSTISLFDSSWAYSGPVNVQTDGSFQALYTCVFVQLYCVDGSAAPGNDQANCSEVLCPDGSVAPSGDLALCPVDPPPDPDPIPDPPPDPVLPDFGEWDDLFVRLLVSLKTMALDTVVPPLNSISGNILALTAVLNQTREALMQRIADVASSSTLAVTTAINQQTALLSNGFGSVTASIASASDALGAKLDQVNVYLSHNAALLGSVAANIMDAAVRVEDAFLRQTQDLLTGIGDLRNSVSGAAAMLKASIDEGLLSAKNAVLDLGDVVDSGFDSVTDLMQAAADRADSLAQVVSGMAGAIQSLPNEIANAILTSEAYNSGSNSIVQAVNDGFAAITGAYDGILTEINDTISDVAGTAGMAYDKLDELTTNAADFFAGTPSALSDSGAAALSEPIPENPLADPVEVNLDSMLSTTVSGGGGCPAPATAEVMGQTITFHYDQLCDWAETVGKLVLILASILSLRIIAKE